MGVIDYVVPMVFNDDHEWRRSFARVGRAYDERATYDFVRYRSWGTERLLVELVKRNMPFVRHIIIILAQESQVRDWMVGDERVRVVFHRDFIPARHLPTFNSRAMEMFLKDIPGLSEAFLYGNDDMYPLSPLTESDFFEDGKPCIVMHERKFPDNPNNFQLACRGGLNFVASEFGTRYVRTWLKNGHSIAPILRSTCEHLWERGRREIEASVTPFRETVNFNQYIYSWWQWLSGECVERAPRRTYVNVRTPISSVVAAIEGDDAGIVCVNDNECLCEYMEYGRAVASALEGILNRK